MAFSITMMKNIDLHCFMAAMLFLLSDCMAIILFLVAFSHRTQDFSLNTLQQLDPMFIQTEWEWTIQYNNMNLSYEIINSFAWFVMCIPIIKVAWIQSNYGTRMMGLNITIVVLALGGSFAELLARLLALGSNNALGWLASSFNLNDWDVVVSSSSNSTTTTGGSTITNDDLDRIGWRTLEMINVAVSGLLLWIDAIEYLFLSGILILFAISIRTNNELFAMKWAKFGLFVALLGMIEFIMAILRFENWNVFSTFGGLINILNQLILFPVWLIWLGKQLPKAEATRNAHKPSHNNNNGATEEGSENSMLT